MPRKDSSSQKTFQNVELSLITKPFGFEIERRILKFSTTVIVVFTILITV